MSPGYQESESVRKIKLIKAINKILESRGRQLSPEDFDVLYDVPVDELVDIRFKVAEKYSQMSSLEAL